MPQAHSKMLGVFCKKTDDIDIKSPILKYVRNLYGSDQAAELEEDASKLQDLRRELVHAGGGGVSQLDKLMRYYRALQSIEARIPISKQSDNAQVTFTWADAFRSAKKTSQSNIHFEKSAVMFNIAAAKSQAGLQADRYTTEGISDACKRFQEAAGIFAHVRDTVSTRMDAPRPLDLGSECCTMLERLMIAQAAECVVEKAVKDGKSPTVVARLAQQAALLYSEVSRLFGDPAVASHFDRAWVGHVVAKENLFLVEALQQQAAVHRSKSGDEIGMEISRLREARNLLAQARTQARQSGNQELAQGIDSLDESLAAQLQRAEKDNHAVYLQRVPPAADLPVITPALLVKGVLPPELSKQPESWFESLVPESSAKAVSRYSDMVDSLVRQLLEQLAGATDDARVALRQAELPDILDALHPDSHAALPEGLKQLLAEAVQSGGVRHLDELSQSIRDLRRQTEEDVAACERQLNTEAQEDEGLRQQYGALWNRPPSHVLTSHLHEKIAGYRSNLQVAGESDTRVAAKLRSNHAAIVALTPETAAAQMPVLQAPMLTTDVEPSTVVANLRNGVKQSGVLAQERGALEEAVQDVKGSDNILPRLIAHAGSEEQLFATELAKYDPLKTKVEGNVRRTRDVLKAIEANYAAFKEVFAVEEWRKQCEVRAKDIRATAELFKELSDNLSEGVRFYNSLQEAVRTLHQYVGDYCTSRKINKEEMLEDLQKRQANDTSRDEALARQLAQQGSFNPQGTNSGMPTPPSNQVQLGQQTSFNQSAPQPTPYMPGAPPTHSMANLNIGGTQPGAPPQQPPPPPAQHPTAYPPVPATHGQMQQPGGWQPYPGQAYAPPPPGPWGMGGGQPGAPQVPQPQYHGGYAVYQQGGMPMAGQVGMQPPPIPQHYPQGGYVQGQSPYQQHGHQG